MTFQWRTGIAVWLAVTVWCGMTGCGQEPEKAAEVKSPMAAKQAAAEKEKAAPAAAAAAEAATPLPALPAGLVWETNNEDPVWAAKSVKKGGTLRSYMLGFPLTLRTVGPDSNGSFRSNILANQMSLTDLHPDTHRVIPALATHWAYDPDGRTVYYKLNPAARWSDGKPVTADDFVFTLTFMRSKHIVAPWYNDHYTKRILEVIKYDDHTIAVKGAVAKPRVDLHYYYGLSPTPRHFHKLDENWVKDTNWKVEPNTGPYRISKIKKGKSIEFERKKDWWAGDLRYNRNRYNVDRVRIKVIRDANIAYKHFEKGELDTFALVLPDFWHDRAKGEIYDKGYVHKIWFYNDTPQPGYGVFLNQDFELFADRNARYGFAHALNIKKVLATVLRGDYLRMHTLHTGYGAYSNTRIRARAFDLEKAEHYMALAGWQQRGPDGIRVKDGQRFSVVVNYGAKHHNDRLVVLKEEALKAGIELVLKLMDPSSSFKNILEKKHQVAWMGWGASFRPAYWQHYHSENAHKTQTNNITNTDDPDMDRKIMAYRDEIDEKRRIALAHELEEKIHSIGAAIPTYMVPYSREAFWRWMRLPQHHGTRWSESLFEPFGTTGGVFWIDVDRKSETMSARKAGKGFEPVLIVDETYRKKRG
jgi:microcin C transport system substrate-binding protein